ncbi:MAG: 16S rRNA processing protein RimM [Alphaproteobacteria bacterium]|nr:16S rRNA processing protein RimM [Alphaproteobacteria bacterium]MBO4644310.1 16S rRNA processing protein RimM [Alphaproteobacteria bacterium]
MTGTGERENLICVGAITTAHGVRGLVKVKSFTRNAADFAAFGELSDASAKRSFKVEIVGKNKDLFLVKIDGVTDRNAAEALRGTELFVSRSRLPETAGNEFYYADLVGMTAKSPDGSVLGKVAAVYNFGAGDMIEIEGVEDFISFCQKNVPEVDVKNREMTVCLPESVEAKPEERPES